MKQPIIIENARDLLRAYPVVFCDVWGVVHNGVREYAGAGDALERYRAGGGHVVLLSNAPTPSPSVARVLKEKGVRRSAWDAIVSSGDITRLHLEARRYRRIFHIGPDRSLPLFDGIAAQRPRHPERHQGACPPPAIRVREPGPRRRCGRTKIAVCRRRWHRLSVDGWRSVLGGQAAQASL